MADWQQYLQKAERNEKLADDLASLPQRYPEWEITALFYSALHYANAFLASRGQSAEFHRERYTLLASQTSLGKEYDTLFHRSMNARYDIYDFSEHEVDQIRSLYFGPVKEGVVALIGNRDY